MKNSILYFKRFAAIFLVFAAILSSTPFVIYGNEIIADDMAVLIPEQDFDSALEALAYSYPPDNLYPFIYDGTPPSTWRNINTAECVIGRLYVFNEDTGAVTPIGSHTVVTFATTKDHLFYVTDDQTIAITDYTGSFFTPIYQPKQGTITMLSAYGNFLHFVEDECAVVVLDVPNQAIKVRISHSAISSAYMFDEDKLIWYDAQGNAKYYNMTSQQTITLADEAEESNLVSAYLAPNVPADTAAVQSSTVVNSVGIPDAYNDITFPLAEYPATPAMTNYTLPSPVRSRFLENSINGSLPKTIVSKKYAGEPECDGFAKYAHDVFWHVADASRTGPSWYNNDTYSLDCHWNKTWSSEQELIDFF